MKPAESLYRQHLASGQQALRLANDVTRLAGLQCETGAADGTGVRLRMETPACWIVILGLAGGAHPECGHGGPVPVIRNVADDGVTRATVGAIGEGVAKPGVFRVGEITAAIVAGCEVWRNQNESVVFLSTLQDGEAGHANRLQLSDGDLLDVREWRRLAGQTLQEAIDGVAVAFHFHLHAFGSVLHPAVELKLLRQAIHERAKANALNNAGDSDLFARDQASTPHRL